MHIRGLALAVGSVLAALPVYLVNTEGLAPPKKQVESFMGPLLFSHFTGDGHTDDIDATADLLETLNYVPGIFMDDRAAKVVVLTDLSKRVIENLLGTPLFELEEGANSFLQGSSPYPTVSSASDVEESNSTILEISSNSVNPAKLMHDLRALRSKIMLVGVPKGHNVPQLTKVSNQPMVSSRAEKKTSDIAKFNSVDECQAATNFCSGRGDCVGIAGSYRCSCKAVQSNGYTYKFGGVDCAKRDISMQFHLLAWTTIAIVFSLTFGIGMVFSLDSEPLPGILTALTK